MRFAEIGLSHSTIADKRLTTFSLKTGSDKNSSSNASVGRTREITVSEDRNGTGSR
jgi:hypothetical protein